jgi:hypothetical protein
MGPWLRHDKVIFFEARQANILSFSWITSAKLILVQESGNVISVFLIFFLSVGRFLFWYGVGYRLVQLSGWCGIPASIMQQGKLLCRSAADRGRW